MKKFLAVPAILGLLFASGCEVPEEPDSYSDQGKTTQEASDTTLVTKPKKKARPRWVGKMNQISLGMSQSQVKSILGKPDDTTSSQSEFMGETTTMDIWSYGNMLSSKDGNDIWSLTFMDGKLDGKTRI